MATDVIKTIGATSSPTTPDYSTLQAWEDAAPANLVTADQRWIGECLDQGEFTGAGAVLTVAGSTTDSTRYKYLRCATGASFKDKAAVRTTALRYNASNGVGVRSTSGNYGGSITPGESYFRMEGVQVKGFSYGMKPNGGTGVVYSQCIIEGGSKSAIGNGTAQNATYKNSLLKSPTNWGGFAGFGVNHFYACTLIGAGTAKAFECLYGTSTAFIKNCAVFGFSTFSAGWSGTNASYNATDLATGLGSNNQTSLTYANQVENTSNDYRAKSTGNLQAGTPDSTNTPADISGFTRNLTTPWIGCWEVGSTSNRRRRILIKAA